jgi:hypothetical protein
MLQQLLDPEKQTQFSRYANKLTIHMNWQDFVTGQFLLIEAYTSLDPDTYSEIYDDPMLKKYATALIKRQWGANLSKFEGIPLPGNITFNGQRIYQEALEEIAKIEDAVRTNITPGESVTQRGSFVNNTNTWTSTDGNTKPSLTSLSKALRPDN